MRATRGLFALSLGRLISGATWADQNPIIAEDHLIKSSTPGIELFVRNKHATNLREWTPDRTLLFIHGATYPAETSFDLPVEGESMMDMFARAGFDVFLVDVRG
jgi:alpha-beta hydrolase superfamily lysophospholipase